MKKAKLLKLCLFVFLPKNDNFDRAEVFSIRNILKNWFAERYGKNADVKHLYAWAAENGYFINRYNPIPERKCRILLSNVNYPAFEVEVLKNGFKKGFHFALLYDLVGVTPYAAEIDLSELEFKDAFRLENDEITIYKN